MDDRRSSGGNELRASLGLFDSTMLVVGAVFGSGIFLTTGIIAAQIPFSGVIWLAWFGGGLVTIAGALCYGELGSLFPKAGGPYVYLQRAYGRGAAFFFGWTFFWIIGGGGIAALAVGFSEYAGFLGLGLPRPVLAVLAVWMLTALNAFGVGLGSRIQAGLAAVRILAVLALAGGAAVLAVKSGLTNIHPVWPSAAREFSWTAMGAAMVAVFWAYDGWYSVNCTAEEIRSPAATIPRSLALGTGFVVLLYLAANLAYSITVPMSELRGLVRVGESAASGLFGPERASLFGAVIALAVLGCLGANILFCARVPFAMARDGLFFRAFGRVHPKTAVPLNALVGQMIWASLLCLSGTYERLVEFVMFAAVLFYAATGAAVIVLRKKAPAAARPYRVWGYPILPSVYVAVNLAIVLALVFEKPLPSLAGAGFVLSGGPAYLFWRNGVRSRAAAENGEVSCPRG